MRILVTGASGFLGASLARQAVRRGWDVLGTHHSRPRSLPGFSTRPLDLEDTPGLKALVRDFRPQCVAHAAAVSKPDDCARDPERCRRVQVEATRLLAREAAALKARFLYTSSDLVYDGSREWVDETGPARPLGAYGRSKLEAEEAVLGTPGLDACVLRISLIFGWSAGGARCFVEDWIESLRQGRPFSAFADQYRCPLWVEDAAASLLDLAVSPATGIFHLAGPERLSRLEFARMLCRVFGFDQGLVRPGSVKDAAFLDPRPLSLGLKTGRLISALARPPLGPEEALREMLHQAGGAPVWND